MLSHEVGTFTGVVETLEVSEFLADTVILLKRGERERGIYRGIEDHEEPRPGLRLRAAHVTNRRRQGAGGLSPRAIEGPRGGDGQPTSMTQRSVNGTDPIDGLMGGGLYEGSVTMVVGVSGVGKTVFSTQMLVEGARKLGERGLLVTLDEHPAQIRRNAKILGLGLDEQVEAGIVQITLRFAPGTGNRRPLRPHHPDRRGDTASRDWSSMD